MDMTLCLLTSPANAMQQKPGIIHSAFLHVATAFLPVLQRSGRRHWRSPSQVCLIIHGAFLSPTCASVNAGAEMTLTPMQDGGRVPSGDVRDRIPGDGRRPCQRLPVLHDGSVQLRPVHGDGHVEREIKKVETIPSIHPSLNSELLSSESLTLHAPDMFAATARLVRPRRRLQHVDGGVEARVLRRGGGGGVDGRAGGGDTGGVLLAGLGVPRCQVRRRDNVPQVRRAASC